MFTVVTVGAGRWCTNSYWLNRISVALLTGGGMFLVGAVGAFGLSLRFQGVALLTKDHPTVATVGQDIFG